MGGPTSAIIIANAVLQLVGVVKGRSHIRSLMPPAELKLREEGEAEEEKRKELVRQIDKMMPHEVYYL